jgi:cytochrome c biogenesis protein CcmG, thiol:disulfide interchange protein DsbE
MSRKAKAAVFWALALAIACLALACGEEANEYGSEPPDYAQALAGAPKPLAALHAQANELLDGGTAAFESRLEALRGFPVVVNKWASWCGPCRFEFPFFQRLSARYGKQVAFVGVDSQDSEDAARTFLREFPVSYPSYSDSGEDIAALIKATLGFPSTAFYSPSGELVYTKQGGYSEQADLEADIRRYAVGAAGESGGSG